ncbi:MAG: hypothetical protein AB1757_26425 [Acidobacteriota bacterium]
MRSTRNSSLTNDMIFAWFLLIALPLINESKAIVVQACPLESYEYYRPLWDNDAFLALLYFSLWILFFASVGLIIERQLSFSSIQKNLKLFTRRILLALTTSQIAEAIKISQRYKTHPLATSTYEVIRTKQNICATQAEENDFYAVAYEYALTQSEIELKSRLKALKNIGIMSLCAGLVGTIVCLYTALLAVNSNDEYYFSPMPWIYEIPNIALYSSVIGGGALGFYKRLSKKASRILNEVDYSSREILNRLMLTNVSRQTVSAIQEERCLNSTTESEPKLIHQTTFFTIPHQG